MKNIITNNRASRKSNKNEFRDQIYEMTKTHRRNEKEILELRSYPRAFVKLMGSNDGALFLRQLIYWTDRPKKNRDGFFYKSVREWYEELDLTEYQVEKFRAFLKDKGILEMVKRRIGKYKEQWHYRINKQRFKEVYQELLENEYVFPYEDEILDDEDFDLEIVEEQEAPELDDILESEVIEALPILEEVDASNQNLISSNQESIRQNRANISSFEVAFASFQESNSSFQENNNNILHNKLNIELPNKPSNELQHFRNTESPANFSRTNKLDTSDGKVTFRSTGGDSISDSYHALEVFRSVGANSFDMTLKNENNPEDTIFRENFDLVSQLEEVLEWCNCRPYSFIVRPRGAALIQIDDCNAETVNQLLPFCFFAEETSEGNFQVWLALPNGTSEDELKKIRKRLFENLASGNGGTYGATRWVGSKNYKTNRRNFRVRLVYASERRFTNVEELEAAGLLAASEKQSEKSKVRQSETKGFRGSFPDYSRCLRDKDYDRSDADASFLAICKDRGFSREESLEKLEEVSERAQERHSTYLDRTADFIFSKE